MTFLSVYFHRESFSECPFLCPPSPVPESLPVRGGCDNTFLRVLMEEALSLLPLPMTHLSSEPRVGETLERALDTQEAARDQ